MNVILVAANVPSEQHGGVANVVRAHVRALRKMFPEARIVHIPGQTSFIRYQGRCLTWLATHPCRPSVVISHGPDGLLLLLLGRVLAVPKLITVWHGLSVTLDRVMQRQGHLRQIPPRQALTAWLTLRLARRRLVMSRADQLWLRLVWRLQASVIRQGRVEAEEAHVAACPTAVSQIGRAHV